ncbi:hypothetical protein L1049_000067 [Liquidambar formosana]|uniref:Uncharacterized protein n=1 Tax=Liquidambar formosana TaxID=63359 RepID=A0AAP0R4V1_LIQFO
MGEKEGEEKEGGERRRGLCGQQEIEQLSRDGFSLDDPHLQQATSHQSTTVAVLSPHLRSTLTTHLRATIAGKAGSRTICTTSLHPLCLSATPSLAIVAAAYHDQDTNLVKNPKQIAWKYTSMLRLWRLRRVTAIFSRLLFLRFTVPDALITFLVQNMMIRKGLALEHPWKTSMNRACGSVM